MTQFNRRLRTVQLTDVVTRFAPSAASASAPSLERTRETQSLRRFSIAAVWRDTLTTFSTHSAAILCFAFVGFALPTIAGNWLHTSAKLSEYARTRAVVTLYDKPALSALFIQAGLGLLTSAFARGAITWLALYGKQRSEDSKAHGGFCAARRATVARFPALMVGSLLYGALITAGIVAMSELTRGLEFIPSKMAHFWPGPHRTFGDMLRQLRWRGFTTMMPSPGPPFAEFIPDLRHGVFKQVTHVTYHERYVNGSASPEIFADVTSETTLVSLGVKVITTHGISLMAVAGVALIFVAETLLRLRTVMALKPPGSPRPPRFIWLGPLAGSLHFGLRHFGAITVHLWLMRLAFLLLTVALVEFPVAMMDHFLVPHVMRFGGNFEALPILRFSAAASAALVNAILMALSVVYDAQLFRQLTPLPSAHAVDTDTRIAGHVWKIAPCEPAC